MAQQQVVAKPLGDGLGKIPGVSGGAILPDGRVGLILDPRGLSALARRTQRPVTEVTGDAAQRAHELSPTAT